MAFDDHTERQINTLAAMIEQIVDPDHPAAIAAARPDVGAGLVWSRGGVASVVAALALAAVGGTVAALRLGGTGWLPGLGSGSRDIVVQAVPAATASPVRGGIDGALAPVPMAGLGTRSRPSPTRHRAGRRQMPVAAPSPVKAARVAASSPLTGDALRQALIEDARRTRESNEEQLRTLRRR